MYISVTDKEIEKAVATTTTTPSAPNDGSDPPEGD